MQSRDVLRSPDNSPRITLTFDNGPTPGVTEQVLDLLAERRLGAYFFVVSDRVNAHPHGAEILERMLRDGHIVGNHSASHGAPLGELTAAEALTEITTAHDALREFVGDHFLLRPWGTEGVLGPRCLNRAAVEYLISGKHTCVLWNSVPGDWSDPVGWVDRALADVAAHEHMVLVVHDLPTGAMDQLPRFLTELAHAGVAVVQDLPESCVPIRDGQLIEHRASGVARALRGPVQAAPTPGRRPPRSPVAVRPTPAGAPRRPPHAAGVHRRPGR